MAKTEASVVPAINRSLEKFVNKKHKLLVVFGIFLAVLSFSLSSLIDVNTVYSGRIAIASILILFLLFLAIMQDQATGKRSNVGILFFLLLLGAVTVFIFLGITEAFEAQWNALFQGSIAIALFFFGGWLGIKLIKFTNMKRKDLVYWATLFFVSSFTLLLIIIYWKFLSNLDINDYLKLFLVVFIFISLVGITFNSAENLIYLIKKSKHFRK